VLLLRYHNVIESLPLWYKTLSNGYLSVIKTASICYRNVIVSRKNTSVAWKLVISGYFDGIDIGVMDDDGGLKSLLGKHL